MKNKPRTAQVGAPLEDQKFNHRTGFSILCWNYKKKHYTKNLSVPKKSNPVWLAKSVKLPWNSKKTEGGPVHGKIFLSLTVPKKTQRGDPVGFDYTVFETELLR